MAGADCIDTVIGPLSTSLSGIKVFMKTIIDTKPWLVEPALTPLPWDSSLKFSDVQPLKVAVLWHDDIVRPHPPVTNALRSVVSKLQNIPNVSVVDWKPHLHNEAWAIISSLYFTDGGAEDSEAIESSGEPWRPLTEWIIKENPCVKKLSIGELSYWLEEREAYRKEYAKVWNDTAIEHNPQTGELDGLVDVILCPVGPGVAPIHNTAKYWYYTSQWNLLNYPAVVFPVDKVDPQRDRKEDGYKPMTSLDRDNWKLCKTHWQIIILYIAANTQQMIRRHLLVFQFHYSLLDEDTKMRRFSRFSNTCKKRLVYRSQTFHSSTCTPEHIENPSFPYTHIERKNTVKDIRVPTPDHFHLFHVSNAYYSTFLTFPVSTS